MNGGTGNFFYFFLQNVQGEWDYIGSSYGSLPYPTLYWKWEAKLTLGLLGNTTWSITWTCLNIGLYVLPREGISLKSMRCDWLDPQSTWHLLSFFFLVLENEVFLISQTISPVSWAWCLWREEGEWIMVKWLQHPPSVQFFSWFLLKWILK